jgi:hypothetical protein
MHTYSYFLWILLVVQNLTAGPGLSKCWKHCTQPEPFYNTPQNNTPAQAATAAAADAKQVNEQRVPESPRSSTRCNAQTCRNGKHSHFDGIKHAKAQVAAKQQAQG